MIHWVRGVNSRFELAEVKNLKTDWCRKMVPSEEQREKQSEEKGTETQRNVGDY